MQSMGCCLECEYVEDGEGAAAGAEESKRLCFNAPAAW